MIPEESWTVFLTFPEARTRPSTCLRNEGLRNIDGARSYTYHLIKKLGHELREHAPLGRCHFKKSVSVASVLHPVLGKSVLNPEICFRTLILG
jgi:hypothetical protein